MLQLVHEGCPQAGLFKSTGISAIDDNPWISQRGTLSKNNKLDRIVNLLIIPELLNNPVRKASNAGII